MSCSAIMSCSGTKSYGTQQTGAQGEAQGVTYPQAGTLTTSWTIVVTGTSMHLSTIFVTGTSTHFSTILVTGTSTTCFSIVVTGLLQIWSTVVMTGVGQVGWQVGQGCAQTGGAMGAS